MRDFLKTHFEYEIDVFSAQQLSAEHFGNDSEAILAELIERGWLEKGQRTWTPAVGPATVHATYNRTDLGQRGRDCKANRKVSSCKGRRGSKGSD
jgi:hypothetical protein